MGQPNIKMQITNLSQMKQLETFENYFKGRTANAINQRGTPI